MKIPLVTIALVAFFAIHAVAQKDSGASATVASADFIKGKLNPETSKIGDQITVRLRDDVKSNGNVVLKKGTTLVGVVSGVKRLEPQDESPMRSYIEIHWVPTEQPDDTSELRVAVESITQTAYLARDESGSNLDPPAPSERSLRGAGLVNATFAPTNPLYRSNAALLNMPSIVVADTRTASMLNAIAGETEGPQWFQTGHGEIVSAGGFKEPLDIFSHLNNDTVVASRSKTFEVSNGARLQLLVGIQRN